jgi:hypothetical protein
VGPSNAGISNLIYIVLFISQKACVFYRSAVRFSSRLSKWLMILSGSVVTG